METFPETGWGKNGKSQLHLKDEALCFGFLPSVEMTIVLEKKKGSECGRLRRPHSLYYHHLVASHSDRREESLTKPLSVFLDIVLMETFPETV